MTLKYHLTIFSSTTLLMLGVYAAFVGFFFFTYGAYTEKTVVKNQIDSLISDFTDDLLFFGKKTLSNDDIAKINDAVQAIQPPDMTKEDKEVEDNNSALITKATITLSITLVVFLLLSVGVWYVGLSAGQKKKDSYTSMVQRIILLMIIVMLTEFLFFTLVAGNYHPVDPNQIKKYLVKSVQTYAKTPIKNELVN
jgi:hypothetical protein